MFISDPDTAFIVRNFNGVMRDRYGVYAEWKGTIGESTQLDFGARFGRVVMNAGPVSLPPLLNVNFPKTPPVILQNRFNGTNRQRCDSHYDLSLRLHHELNRSAAVSFSAGRKTRSPSYIERYLWLPIEATAGLSDFNNYVGNLDLNPEIAREVDFAFHWEGTSKPDSQPASSSEESKISFREPFSIRSLSAFLRIGWKR